MYIKHLSIKNFKSIANAEIDFTPFTMIVGANASGKSNLINVFRFIQDIASVGIDNAIALQGGIPYLVNASLGRSESIHIGFVLDLEKEEWVRRTSDKRFNVKIEEIEYSLDIQPNQRGGGYSIISDKMILTHSCYLSASIRKVINAEYLKFNYVRIFEKKTKQSKMQTSFELTEGGDEKKRLEFYEQAKQDLSVDFFSYVVNISTKEAMLSRISLLLPPYFVEDKFIRVFDFDPKELKKASAMNSTRNFLEDGSNLASVLQEILHSRDRKKKLTTLLNEFLPSIDNLAIENNPDKSFAYKIREKYSDTYFYANYLSDGTVSILAIIIALYFEENPSVIILEEPERNIHPKLLSSILSAAEDVSISRQVIITTHNPQFLKYANVETVRLVTRDNNGFTVVNSPANNERVKIFLDNELGLDDLFLQNMLGG